MRPNKSRIPMPSCSLWRARRNFHFATRAAKTPHEQTVLSTQIAATDRHIDQLVYEIYCLTPDEIRIVEV